MVAHTSYAAGIPAMTAHAAARRLLQNYGSQSVTASALAFRASPQELPGANAHRATASCKGSLRTGTRTCVSSSRMEQCVVVSLRPPKVPPLSSQLPFLKNVSNIVTSSSSSLCSLGASPRKVQSRYCLAAQTLWQEQSWPQLCFS
jgi:hypothetical protein